MITDLGTEWGCYLSNKGLGWISEKEIEDLVVTRELCSTGCVPLGPAKQGLPPTSRVTQCNGTQVHGLSNLLGLCSVIRGEYGAQHEVHSMKQYSENQY